MPTARTHGLARNQAQGPEAPMTPRRCPSHHTHLWSRGPGATTATSPTGRIGGLARDQAGLTGRRTKAETVLEQVEERREEAEENDSQDDARDDPADRKGCDRHRDEDRHTNLRNKCQSACASPQTGRCVSSQLCGGASASRLRSWSRYADTFAGSFDINSQHSSQAGILYGRAHRDAKLRFGKEKEQPDSYRGQRDR